jgi:cyclopropane fatty-acyl-phospholipid synthase-like methyltransferase
MTTPSFTIGADGIDVAALVDTIRAEVEAKTAAGAYRDERVARAERYNLANLRHEADFLSFYLDCLRDAALVDINAFEIIERRTRFRRPLTALKRGIWTLLRFYTYRLWSQQNEVNGLIVTAVEAIESKYRDTLRDLEARVARLEDDRTPSGS